MEFKIDEAFMLLTGRLRATSARELIVKAPLTPIDLRSAAFLTAETIPEGIPFMFARHPSREQRRKLLGQPEESATPQAVLKPVHVPYDTDVKPPTPLSSEQRRILASKFKENMPPGFPNMVVLESPFCENNLPALKASILIQAINGEDSDPTENLMDIPMLYDTGAQATTISEELLSPQFQEFLRTDEIHEPYRTSQTPQQPRLVHVTANICFTNTIISLNLIAIVRPKETMPNHFNGVILGQKGAIDSLVPEMIPKNFLPHLSGEFWGEIHITRVYDIILEEVKEY
ncbi:hypothetical protein F4781DRAFT_102083 [Annulohypoxylon bovei var. microspora]|nr:hypothetical protein F4781DRAFT_102083 [Annulohypoxylon bovei var. microspora]